MQIVVLIGTQWLEILKNKEPHISFQMPALIFVRSLHRFNFHYSLFFLNVIAHVVLIIVYKKAQEKNRKSLRTTALRHAKSTERSFSTVTHCCL